MKNVFVVFCLLFINFNYGQSKAELDILKVMKAQEVAWSNHDIDGFMEGYWKSDNLKFFGKNGVTYGWQQTLDNYKKGYPTKAHMGTLSFTIKDISKIKAGLYSVMGRFKLERSMGNAEGIFMILFKKINGQWKIIADTSC